MSCFHPFKAEDALFVNDNKGLCYTFSWYLHCRIVCILLLSDLDN